MMKQLLILSILFISALAFQSFKSTRFVNNALFMAVKYDKSKYINVSINKPLGAVFEEVAENTANGIYIQECSEGGNAANSGLRAGLVLVESNGIDMRLKDFDGCMDVLKSTPPEVPLDLKFADINEVYRGQATLSIIDTSSNDAKTVECLKGQVLRDILMSANIDLYSMKGKMTNCGGGGVCGTCVVAVDVPEDDAWEPRPEFEAKRLKGYSDTCRLSCNMVVEGDAAITLKPEKGAAKSV